MSPQQTQQQQGISLASFAQVSLIDDIDVEIVDAAFCEWNYNNKIDEKTGEPLPFELALAIQYQDANGRTYDQYYSAGKLDYFVPSEDGSMAIPVAERQLLSDSSNASKFLASLLECGYPQEALETGNVKSFIGMVCHVKQHQQPVRQGLIRGGNTDRVPKVLLVSEIKQLPGEKPAPKKAGISGGIAGAGKPVGARPTSATASGKPGLGKPVGSAVKPSAPPAPGLRKAATATSPSKANGQAGASTTVAGDDDKALAAEMVFEILSEAGGTVTKKALSTAAFRKAGEKVAEGKLDTKSKTKLVQLVFQDSFLHELSESGVIGPYDGATLSLPDAA